MCSVVRNPPTCTYRTGVVLTNDSFPVSETAPDTGPIHTRGHPNTMRFVRPGRRPSALPSDRRHGSGGQSLVEFSLVLMPLFFILLGIIQFGFIFNSYVTLTNAVREGARIGTIYIYSASQSKAQNDLARDESIRSAVLASMNVL